MELLKRPRRNRKNAALRALTEETYLLPSNLVSPHFILGGKNQRESISSLPGIKRLSCDLLLEKAKQLFSLGIRAMLLFPCIPTEKKDPLGSEALNENGLIIQAIRLLKKEIPQMCLITDIALDPFTNHGHDGLVSGKGEILNDETVTILSKMSLLHAEAGVDIVAPSDMMDGRVLAIRKALDLAGFQDTNIMSYTAKYASSFYGPFREALHSTLSFGDKKTYQMNPANVKEALLEADLDQEEGADFLIVKPALFYLDVIAKMKERTNLPIAAYHVSGEYAMVMAAAEKGWLDADQCLFESLLSIKRAGANIILSYAAERIAVILANKILPLPWERTGSTSLFSDLF